MKVNYQGLDRIESPMSEMRDIEMPADDDSQQAAEAMVQLGNVGFYTGEQQPILQQGNFNKFFQLFLKLFNNSQFLKITNRKKKNYR